MRILRFVLATLLGLSVSARADTFTTLLMNGTAYPDHTFSGTLVLDNTSGILVSSDVVLSSVYDAAGSLEHFTQVSDGGIGYIQEDPYNELVLEGFRLSSADGLLYGDFSVDAGDATPGHFMGGDICNGLDNCGYYPYLESAFYLPNGDFAPVLHGEITPGNSVATTPEPSSVLLLGSGVLAVLGVSGRRRWAKV